MSKQLSSFLTYVKQDFKRDDKDTEITQAYNDIIDLVASKHPLEGLKFTSYVPTVLKQPDYPLPSNCNHLIHPVKLLEGLTSTDKGYPLEKISKEEYDERYPNAKRTSPDSTGKPGRYCIYFKAILIGPFPDASTYYLEIDWTKYATELSANSDVHALGNNWDLVLKWGVLWLINKGIGLYQEAEEFRKDFMSEEYGYPAKIKEDISKYRKMDQIKNNAL